MKGLAVAAAIATVMLFALAGAAEEMTLTRFDRAAADVSVSQGVEGSVKFSLQSADGGGKFLAMEFERVPEATTAYVKLPLAKAIAANAARFDGLTMRVAGDGSATYGLIEMITGNNGRYQAVFPLTSTRWTTVAIRWDDFFANGDKSQAFMDPAIAEGFAFGSREKWASAKYAVADIALAKIPARPAVIARAGSDRFAHLAANLAKGAPVTIVAFGDSITAGVKVAEANRADKLYFHYIARGLEKAFPGAQVTTVNAGVGGESFGRAIVRMGHQVNAAKPDLVVILFGANDAGSDHPVERVRHELSVMLDHLLTETQADVLVLSPTVGAYKTELLDEYAAMYKAVAAEKAVAYFDLRAAQKALAAPQRERLLYTDQTHMVEYGHERSGEMVLGYILETIGAAPAAVAGNQ